MVELYFILFLVDIIMQDITSVFVEATYLEFKSSHVHLFL